ncbi:MAG: fumarylacetoacetate hydrolase family protein [Verrucomicrobiota bacterium]|nr:fumarylacetoacetate hydrolase family protein [Verrucomicrobiota bacterium]MEC8243916.1 fumarylacetoacetate hydrolase family protein [Verrucomicrobiota bacterium]
MRIFRYLDQSGKMGFGRFDSEGKTFLIHQKDNGDFEATDEAITPFQLLTPIDFRCIYAIGLNYRAHAEETGMEIPKYPMVFMKAPTAVQNPGDPVVLPRFLRSDKVDYEAELGVVIGRPCKNVKPEDALSYVLGYVCANDVSARDWQKEKGGGQFCRGKTFDTFCPVGPCLATADEIPDPSSLTIRSYVNDEKMQESKTDDLIFDVPALISFLSGSTTLLPGTLILTGTPAGVGEARDPKRFLIPGDEVTVEIDGVGMLTNPVVEEVFEEEENKS